MGQNVSKRYIGREIVTTQTTNRNALYYSPEIQTKEIVIISKEANQIPQNLSTTKQIVNWQTFVLRDNPKR